MRAVCGVCLRSSHTLVSSAIYLVIKHKIYSGLYWTGLSEGPGPLFLSKAEVSPRSQCLPPPPILFTSWCVFKKGASLMEVHVGDDFDKHYCLEEKWFPLKRAETWDSPQQSLLLGGSVIRNLPANAGDLGLIPGSGRSPGEGNGNTRQYSCLEKSHGQRSLADYSPWGPKELGMTEQLRMQACMQEEPKLKRQKVDFSEWSEQMDYTQNFKFIEDTHLQVTKSGFQNKTLKKPREVSIQAHNSCSRPYVVTETCKRTPPQKWTRFKWSLYTKSLF